jgi:hypothetical protein
MPYSRNVEILTWGKGVIAGIMNIVTILEVKLFLIFDWNQLRLLYGQAGFSP